LAGTGRVTVPAGNGGRPGELTETKRGREINTGCKGRTKESSERGNKAKF
jgi:hypothetical protein